MVLGRKRRGSWRTAHFALTLAVAFGFFVQAFIAQTHIHGAPPAAAAHAQTLIGNHHDGTPFDPFPASIDPANQVHAGNYSSPGAVLLVRPALSITRIVHVREARAPAFILAHSWRSRAPPIA